MSRKFLSFYGIAGGNYLGKDVLFAFRSKGWLYCTSWTLVRNLYGVDTTIMIGVSMTTYILQPKRSQVFSESVIQQYFCLFDWRLIVHGTAYEEIILIHYHNK